MRHRDGENNKHNKNKNKMCRGSADCLWFAKAADFAELKGRIVQIAASVRRGARHAISGGAAQQRLQWLPGGAAQQY